MKSGIICLLPLVCSIGLAEEISVHLRKPVLKNGVLYTTQGGVIEGEELRIQAQNIQYFHRMENGKMVQKIEADGDLMVQYRGKVFIGSELDFDLLNKQGTLYDAKTFASLWYVGGDQITLNPDGSYRVANAFLTTCENKDSSWDIRAKTIDVLKERQLIAESVRFRLLDKMSFWLPSFKMNLKKFKEPIFRYYFNWLKEPKVGARYQFYSSESTAAFGMLEYRVGQGWGGALETQYLPDDRNVTFVTSSYAGKDRLFNAVNADFRYRVQGAFHGVTRDDKTKATITWDKYSDVRMPGDFKDDEFEINTAKRTLFYLHHREEELLTSLKVRPRVNPFESIKQDLPTFYLTTHPTPIGKTGIISSNFVKASFVDFKYSSQLVSQIPDYQSGRLELYEKLTRPYHLQYLTLTPYLAGRAILYSTGPNHRPTGLGLFDYGLKAFARGQRQLVEKKHVIEPYLRYQALSVSNSEHYIFSIQDGYANLQEIAVGCKNLLFGQDSSFSADLVADAFFAESAIPQVIPRGYLFLEWEYPKLHLFWDNCYNFRDRVVDFSNIRCLWTVNDNVAFTLEARYRSRYDWRKADHENFILDVTRHQTELLTSPLSDRRITLLSNFFLRLTPFWELQWESHHGFYRIDRHPYNEFKIHLYTWLSSSWKLGLHYGYTFHNHFDWTINLKLVKQSF